jgi:hypothetical protein
MNAGDEGLEADYLVIGAGAGGMAFADTLISESDRTLVIVDRRHAPGGHWNDAYPFVRLHQPSAYYGCNSLALGTDRIDSVGQNRGMYEVAGPAEICGYYDRVMRSLAATGRVRWLPSSDCVADADGGYRVVSRLSGKSRRIVARRSVVDATYLQTSVPATHVRNFEVADGVRCIPVNGLASAESPSGRYVVLGAGKTAMDACLYLLDQGVEPSAIRWVKPRDAWLLDRHYSQPLALASQMLEGVARQAEAAAAAKSVTDLFGRLEAAGMVLRVDPRVTPTMYRCATVTQQELSLLRKLEDVVRLGRVKRLEPHRITLQNGSVEAAPGDLYVDCTAIAFDVAPSRRVFERDRITLQPLRTCQPCFNSALIAHVEVTRDELEEKNRLCAPNAYPMFPADWVRMFVASNLSEGTWSTDAEVSGWMQTARLNVARGLRERRHEPEVRAPMERIKQSMGPALQNLMSFRQR